MTVRIHTMPGYDYLADVASAFAHTTAHGHRVGLLDDDVRAAIGQRLCVDAEAGRVTDWALLCDHLTAVADSKFRKDTAMTNTTVPIPEPVMPCPGGCGTDLNAGDIACIDCWTLLPISLQQAVKRARGETRIDASRAAISWLREMVVDGQQKNPPKSTFILADGGFPR